MPLISPEGFVADKPEGFSPDVPEGFAPDRPEGFTPDVPDGFVLDSELSPAPGEKPLPTGFDAIHEMAQMPGKYIARKLAPELDPEKSILGITSESVQNLPPRKPEENLPGSWIEDLPGVLSRAAARTGIGLAETATTPHGIVEAAGLATPAAPAVIAKWMLDMGHGVIKSIPAAWEAYQRGDWQGVADNLAQAGAMGLGVAKGAHEALKNVPGAKPQSAEASPEAAPAPKPTPIGVTPSILKDLQAQMVRNQVAAKEAGQVPETPAPTPGAAPVSEAKVGGETTPLTPPAEAIVTQPVTDATKGIPQAEVSDRAKYDGLVAVIVDTNADPGVRAAAWKEVEQIKNKYGGNPPPKEASADKVPSSVETVRGETPGPAAQVAEGGPAPVQETAQAGETTSAPEIEGMGAAKIGEVQEQGSADVTGLAARVREQRELAGKTAPTEPGEGIAPEASVERGRELLKSGVDPEQIMSDFERTKRASSDDYAVARARKEELDRATNRAEEQFGTDSNEWRQAFNTASDWAQRTKAMQTEWAKSGHAQQGEVDIDTGTFSGLARAFKDDTGRDFTRDQSRTAKTVAETVRQAKAKYDSVKQTLFDFIDKIPITQAEKSGPIWTRAKEYIARGMDNYDDIRHKLATDLGMTVDDVTRELGKNRPVKRLADDAWRKQQVARGLDQAAKRWLMATKMPMYQRALSGIPKFLFKARVGFHGTVALGTHAPMVAFQPKFWKIYADNFVKMYRMVNPHGGRQYYEIQLQNLVRKPNYTTAQRAGLGNDPFQYEDFNNPKISAWVGGYSGMGNRGYFVLKLLRQDMFDQQWDALPKTMQTPDMAKALATDINHQTGYTQTAPVRGAHIALFAPRLLMSRGAWLIVDPAKSVGTVLNWKNATEAQKAFALNQVQEKVWVISTFLSLLAINQGILMATGSKQKINGIPESLGGAGFDPSRSDFLKFKALGKELSYGNAMLTMARLPIRMGEIRLSDGGKLKNLIYPDESSYSVIGEWLRSQASPFASLGADLWFRQDWQGRPLPNSNRPVPKRLKAQGIKPYTWWEYGTEQALPIPAQEAAREIWRHQGMPDATQRIAEGVLWTLFQAGTGSRVKEDIEPKQKH